VEAQGTFLGKTAPKNPPNPLNSLFLENSTAFDEGLADESDEFFRFMIWNDLFFRRRGRRKVKFHSRRRAGMAIVMLRSSLLNLMILMT
jgi:hypothetical protein